MNQAEIEKKLGELLVIGKAALSEREHGGPVDDKAYASRMQAALAQINRPDYPAGMILWLDTAHPDLYAELTSRLPDEIHRLWEAHAPFEEFEYTLECLVATHQRAVALYRERCARQRQANHLI